MLIPSLVFFKKGIKGQESPTKYNLSLLHIYRLPVMSKAKLTWLRTTQILCAWQNTNVSAGSGVMFPPLHQEKGRKTFQCF